MTGIAALALGTGLLAAPPAAAAGDRGHGPADSAWPRPARPPLSEQEQAIRNAQQQAKAGEKPVLVDHLTTESSRTFANPSGTLTTETAPAIERVKGTDGRWQPVDTTLRANSDGTVTPNAVPSKLTLSGGGTGPMVTMTTTDGKKLAITAPFPLPKPTLDGAAALYKSVLPDVDLELSTNTLGGWRQVLIVRTSRAAANPALRKLRLGVEAEGLNVTSDTTGNIKITDGTGKQRFSGPPSTMWDSATTSPAAPAKSAGTNSAQADPLEGQPETSGSATSSPAGPGAGAGVAPVTVTANGQSIEIVPDPTLLGQGTGPWYIDPGINPSADNGTQAWSQVQEAYLDTNEYNGTTDGQNTPAAGYCGYASTCTRQGRERAYFQVGINSVIHGAEVLDARLYATVVSSSSPSTPSPMGLYWTGPIGNPTTWRNQPCGSGSVMGGCAKIGGINISGTGEVQYDVTTQMKYAARDRWSNFTFGLAPDNEYEKTYRQRFGNSPHIAVTYDITPTIWWPRTRPTPGFADTASYSDCRTPGTANPWDNPGWVGANNDVTLTTSTWSPTGRQLMTTFEYWDDDNGQNAQVPTPWNGSYGDAFVDIGALTDGHQYHWQASTTDDTLTSGTTEMCYFRVDRTPPTSAVTSTDFPASGTIGAHPKLAGQEGTFTLTGTDPVPAGTDPNAMTGRRTSGLACARWTTDPVKAAATGWKCTDTDSAITKLTDGKATVKITPPRWGTNFVYLQTQDNAGNMSQPAVYSYYAPSDPNSTAPVFGDLTGDRKADVLLPDTSGALRVIGGGSDPAAAPNAGNTSAPGTNGWNGIQTTHHGSLGYKTVDDLYAHAPGAPDLRLYLNNGTTGRFDSRDPIPVTKPSECVTPAYTPLVCADHGYSGSDWSKVTQIAAFGSHTGDTVTKPNSLPRTTLLFIENGRLWLGIAGEPDQLDFQAILLSGNDTKWSGYDLITPGRAQGTNFPTLWARSKSDGTLHAFTVKGTADAPDLTGFTNPAAGLISGKIDPKTYPRVGSDGDLNGDAIPDLWAVDTAQQLVSFDGVGTAPNGTTVPHPTVTGINPAAVSLGNLNSPTAQWKLTGKNASGLTEDAVANKNPGTPAGITWTTGSVGGVSTTYPAFSGTSSTITTGKPAVDTRKSFTLTTWAKVDGPSGLVASQDGNRSSAFTLYADPTGQAWRFALARGDTDGWDYDWTDQGVNDAARFVRGAWTRLSVAYSAETGLMRLYVNGILAGTGHHQASTSPAPTGPLVMGRYKSNGQPDPFGPGLTGNVSNFAVYPYAASITAPGANGPINLTEAPGNCVDNAGGSTQDGNKIQIWGCNGTPAQQFEVRNDGTIRVQGKCINAAGAGVDNRTLIELRTCDSSAPSQRFLPRANGAVYNPVSGRCLDLNAFNTTPETQLWLYDCNALPAQRWTIPTLGTAPLPVPIT
ncbi:ricin-type beta-trefoil lectin domain protein [Streptomyces sp. NPDC096339]|uniref:ricin-type beta-trefoil lectin domain protein n=1 Tax=Streptomyces sp. NPDC096339 TaxID=3366086 RepID=UPI00381E1B06